MKTVDVKTFLNEMYERLDLPFEVRKELVERLEEEVVSDIARILENRKNTGISGELMDYPENVLDNMVKERLPHFIKVDGDYLYRHFYHVLSEGGQWKKEVVRRHAWEFLNKQYDGAYITVWEYVTPVNFGKRRLLRIYYSEYTKYYYAFFSRGENKKKFKYKIFIWVGKMTKDQMAKWIKIWMPCFEPPIIWIRKG